jgi:MmgE/PrpD C-terminal domain
VGDPEILALASRVGYELDPSIDYPRQFVGHVQVRLRDGRILEERRDHPRGGPDAPMTREEIESKFRGNASLVMSDAQASRVIRSVGALARAWTRSADGVADTLRTDRARFNRKAKGRSIGGSDRPVCPKGDDRLVDPTPSSPDRVTEAQQADTHQEKRCGLRHSRRLPTHGRLPQDVPEDRSVTA